MFGCRTRFDDEGALSEMPLPHWISRFLTKEWEEGHRRLCVFNFDVGALERTRSSRSLFCETDRERDEKLEQRLNYLVETPIANARNLLSTPGQIAPDWRITRAIFFAIFVQPVRTAAMEKRNDDSLALSLKMSDEELDRIAALLLHRTQLVRLGPSSHDHLMFYPSSGVFTIWVHDPGCVSGMTEGLILPFTPGAAFALISKTAHTECLFEQCTKTALLQGMSVSGKKVSRVVVPPWYLQVPQLRPWLGEMRRTMGVYRKDMHDTRQAAVKKTAADGAHLVVIDRLTHRIVRREEAEADPVYCALRDTGLAQPEAAS